MKVRRNSAVQLGTIVALGTLAAHASGQDATPMVVTPATIEVSQGYGGEMEQDGGAGTEQSDVTHVEKDGRHYLVSVYMSSDVEVGYWQCKCSSFELTALGPKPLATDVQITNNETGERPCNHPRLANNGKDILWIYGTDVMDPEQTATYVQVIDEMCNVLPTKAPGALETGPVLVSDNPDNDCGAADVDYNGMSGAASRFTAGYLDAGGGGQSTAIGLELTQDALGEYIVDTTWRTVVNTPGNIGRPSIQALGTDLSVHCSAMGKQRPPDYGISCGVINTSTGEVLHKEYIFESSKIESRYYNQPTVALLGPDMIAVGASLSNGDGRKTNGKGSSAYEIKVLRVSADGFEQLAHEDGMDLDWQTHSSFCTGAYGPGEAIHMGVMGAPVTGVGQPVMQMLGYESNSILLDKRNQYIAAKHGDSGYAANMYGANPMNQGRDFLRCIGNVPNPGFEQPDGFMPQVKTFFAFPVSGKKSDQPKNALFLSLVPGASNVALSGGADPEGPGTEEETPGTPNTQPNGNSEQAGGCSYTGNASGSGLAALLGLGLLGLARRRRQS